MEGTPQAGDVTIVSVVGEQKQKRDQTWGVRYTIKVGEDPAWKFLTWDETLAGQAHAAQGVRCRVEWNDVPYNFNGAAGVSHYLQAVYGPQGAAVAPPAPAFAQPAAAPAFAQPQPAPGFTHAPPPQQPAGAPMPIAVAYETEKRMCRGAIAKGVLPVLWDRLPDEEQTPFNLFGLLEVLAEWTFSGRRPANATQAAAPAPQAQAQPGPQPPAEDDIPF